MKYPFNGERLKKARIYRGLTVAELAQQVACQRQTLTMYELSKSQPADQSIVSSFAKILNFPESYFYEPTFNSAASAVYFRSLLTTSKKYRTEQAIKMEYLAQIFLMLQDYIQFPAFSPLYLPENILPEDAANNLRQHWNLGDGPLNNLISIVEEHGIFVSTFSSNTTEIDAFSELIHYEGKPTYLIAYSNNKVSAARVHFDIAHELGHIFLHEWSEDLDLLSKEEFKKRENEAHAFAAAFLLPANTFGRDASSGPQTITFYKTLKKKWKVSIAAMIRRAMSLQIMTPENYQF